jgi:fructose-specific phosphotransferase system IIA component
MKLTSILSPECIVVPLDASDKSDAIRQLVGVVASTGRCTDEQQLLKAVFDREAIRSTGIGQGLAVPHGKCDCCTSLIMALGKPSTPIDFDSKDGQPADLIVLLASPNDQTGPHIQALARISRLMLMDEFRSAMASAKAADEVFQIISKFEA